jgi:zinc transport system substrate-binding protein
VPNIVITKFHTLLPAALFLAGAVALMGSPGCRSKAPEAKPTAVATIFAYYDALRAIGGPDVNCEILLPARQSPHEYEPTVQDRATVAKAGLIIRNGLNIDTWVDKMAADNKSAAVLDIGQVVKERGIQPLQTEEVSVTPASETRSGEAEDVSAGNPHIWLDPRVQAMAAEAIRDALIRIDPAHGEGYETRAKAYLEDLRKLDEDFAQAAKTFKQKDFIGFHSAYAYLAQRYGLNQVAAVEELPDQGPSLAQQANIIKLIQEKHIKVIFLENAFSPKDADRVKEETGVKTGILQPLETYDDLNQTYVSLMRENLAALKAALN